jgi:hypothetical protein
VKRKKTYLLLELLIGITLLTFFAFPLISQPSLMVEREIVSLERMELERISECAFAQVKQKFYRNEIPWESFASEEKKEFPIGDEKIQIKLLGLGANKFQKKVFLHTKSEKKINQSEMRLVGIKISFIPKKKRYKRKEVSFFYRLFVKRIPDKIAVG